jgi:hypothetical protein
MHCWLGNDSPISRTNKSADILKHWDMAKCLADHAPLPRIGEENAIKMLIQQVKHKVANVLATEGVIHGQFKHE